MRQTITRMILAILLLAGGFVTCYAADEPKDSEPDARLDQRITYQAEAKKLPEVLADISAQTGVVFKASSSARYWAVRQRKVTLILKDMPLHEFMRELELLLDYHFTKTGKPGEYVYVLWQDMVGRKKEQAALQAWQEKRTRHLKRSIDDTLSDTAKALLMTPEEIEKAKKSDPWLAYLASDPRGKAYSQIIQSIPPEAFDTLLKEEYVPSINIADLPPKAAAAVNQAASLLDKKTVSEMYKGHLPSFVVSSIGLGRTSGWGDDASMPACPFCLYLFAKATDALEGDQYGIDSFLIGPSDADPNTMRYRVFPINEQEYAARSGSSELHKPASSEKARVEPDLEKSVTFDFKKDPERPKDLQWKLEQLAGLNIMLEWFPVDDSGYGTWSGERTLEETLNEIASEDLDWTKQGKTVRFRWKSWAQRRSWEIPYDWVLAWLKLIETNHELGFDTLVEIASKMTDAQIAHNFVPNCSFRSGSIEDPIIARLFEAAGARGMKYTRKILDLYNRLTKPQKDLLWSDAGLPLEVIADDPLIQDAEIPLFMYDMRFKLTRKTQPDTREEGVSLDMVIRVWWQDIPLAERELAKALVSADALLKAQDEPIEITMPWGQLYPPDKQKVKALLDEMRKAREEAAKSAEKAKATDN